MSVLEKAAAEHGPAWVMLLVMMIGAWRMIKAGSPHVVGWLNQIITHNLESAKIRNQLLEKLVASSDRIEQLHANHELADEKRHHAIRDQVDRLATHVTGEVDQFATEQRSANNTSAFAVEAIKRELRAVRLHVTGTPTESDDLGPETEEHPKQRRR